MNRNERTPRTLADCQWTTGYSRAEIHRTGTRWERVMLAMAIGFVGAMILGGFNG